MKELYLSIVQRNTAVASSYTWPNKPKFPAVVSPHPYRAAWALPHTQAPVAHSRQGWCTHWCTAQHFSPHQSPVWSYQTRLALSGCSKLSISLPGWQSWPHSAADSHSCSCYFTCVKYWQFCFLAGALKFNLLFHCLNHWNEYTTEPKNSCLREAAATKPCQQWHTTETQAVEAAQQ